MSATLETGRNKEMAKRLPNYDEFVNDLNSRVIDLIVPFSEGMYVDSRFMGNVSIKKVLPYYPGRIQITNEIKLRCF